MTELAKRRRAIMAGKGSVIWIYDHGNTTQTFTQQGPYAYNTYDTVSIRFVDSYIELKPAASINYNTIKTIATLTPINAPGKYLHLRGTAKLVDTRASNINLFCYASQTLLTTESVPTLAELPNFFPGGDGALLNIRSTTTTEWEWSMDIHINSSDTLIALGLLKRGIYVDYVRISQIWIDEEAV